jgi:dienelactone hydrolase
VIGAADRLSLLRGAVLASLLVFAAAGPALADEIVSFESRGGAKVPLRGYLTRPKGEGPFPAVVLLHSCLGLPASRAAIGRMIAGWGYVALFVDDFATRGLKETCAVDFNEARPDALGALAFLAGQPDVDPRRVAAVGFSQGGDTALAIAAAPEGSGDLAFKATAAFYPPCDNRAGARLRLPTLILVGAADQVTPADACRKLAAAQPAGSANPTVMILAGAGHCFDDPSFAGGKRVFGMWLAYDHDATARAYEALRDFLATPLGR